MLKYGFSSNGDISLALYSACVYDNKKLVALFLKNGGNACRFHYACFDIACKYGDLTERHKCRSPLSLSQVTKLFKMLYVTIGDNNKSKDLLIIKCVKHKLYKFINFLTK